MNLYRRIMLVLVSAISILPISVIHADVNTGKFDAPGMSKEDARIGREDEGGKILMSQLTGQTDKADAKKPPAPKAEKKSTSYFKPSSSYSTQPESDPPRYVCTLSKTGIEAFKDIYWLDVGLGHRTRYEFRSNDIRRTDLRLDQLFLLRSRAYFGIEEILDPLRGAVEFQDSRRYNGHFPHDDRDFNDYELIQAYGELYFEGALGADDRMQQRPIRFRAGRMAYEALDRRLIARNEWRNTTNTFEGFRINLGQETNDWEVDLWAYQPVKRLPTEFDQRIENQWFYGAIGNWRGWSDVITLQPYYMGLVQDGSKTGQIDRLIHAPALRGYGKIGDTGLDYDFNLMYQFGNDGTQRHEAYGHTTEAGYTFKHSWKPRVSAFYGYASGDRHPNDNVNNRFERFFGFGRPWSADDYIVFEKSRCPRSSLSFSRQRTCV